MGVEFEADDVERLGLFLSMLMHANSVVNLTAIREPEAAWERHMLDALTLLPLFSDLPEGARVGDVGSGGGLPAVPLAILQPNLAFSLIESTGKKADFLRRAASGLGLTSVEVLAERAEDVGSFSTRSSPGSRRDVFDIVTARAVGRIAMIAELCVPLVKVGGRVVLVKGERADEELAEAAEALRMLHAEHVGTLETPTGRVVVLEKTMRTPRLYPRRPGEPKRQPLGLKRDG